MNQIKNDIAYFTDVTPIVNTKNFVELLFADLASKSPIIYLNSNKVNIKTMVLSFRYKEIIEEIMYTDNGWGIEFSKLIDIDYYYEHQAKWEKELGNIMKEVFIELEKNPTYEFDTNNFLVDFNLSEIANIKSKYDIETLEVMDHFSNLFTSPKFDRTFKLESKKLTRLLNRY